MFIPLTSHKWLFDPMTKIFERMEEEREREGEGEGGKGREERGRGRGRERERVGERGRGRESGRAGGEKVKETERHRPFLCVVGEKSIKIQLSMTENETDASTRVDVAWKTSSIVIFFEGKHKHKAKRKKQRLMTLLGRKPSLTT